MRSKIFGIRALTPACCGVEDERGADEESGAEEGVGAEAERGVERDGEHSEMRTAEPHFDNLILEKERESDTLAARRG